MTITSLNSAQTRRWNNWLWKSHGLHQLAGHTIYYCDIDYPMFLTPWTSLAGFAMRQERDSEQIMISLDLAHGVRTIAHLWAAQSIDHGGFQQARSFNRAQRDLVTAIRSGRLWWGVESLAEPTFVTSIAYWFPEGFRFPDTALSVQPKNTQPRLSRT